jgi:hypothetical protein
MISLTINLLDYLNDFLNHLAHLKAFVNIFLTRTLIKYFIKSINLAFGVFHTFNSRQSLVSIITQLNLIKWSLDSRSILD